MMATKKVADSICKRVIFSIAACLASIWIIYLGVIAKRDQWVAIIHRTDRCDLSLFQLGLDLLEHLHNESLSIPVAFQMPISSH